MDVIDRVGAGRAWLATLLLGVCLLGGGAALAPGTVWDGFLWRYFWGPVVADAHNAACAINADGAVSYGGPAFGESCAAAVEQGAVVAEPGYSVVSEVGYLLVGLFALYGTYLLLSRLHLGHDRRLVAALAPFVVLGGVLRVVEDVNAAVFDHQLGTGAATAETASMVIEYPLNALLISPLLYLTVSAVAFLALLGSVALSRRDVVESYHRTLAVTGTVLVVVSVAGLVVVALTDDAVGFHPLFAVATLAVATAVAGGLYAGLERLSPQTVAGTGSLALLVLWAHALDGAATVLSADWSGALGLPRSYQPSRSTGEVVVSVTEALQPGSLSAALGTAWPFLAVKLLVALALVWLFSERFVDDNTRLAHLLVIAVVAVGLGPGTRDLLRATLAV